jgi:hypothetical protein
MTSRDHGEISSYLWRCWGTCFVEESQNGRIQRGAELAKQFQMTMLSTHFCSIIYVHPYVGPKQMGVEEQKIQLKGDYNTTKCILQRRIAHPKTICRSICSVASWRVSECLESFWPWLFPKPMILLLLGASHQEVGCN